jgi:hypothetical protein
MLREIIAGGFFVQSQTIHGLDDRIVKRHELIRRQGRDYSRKLAYHDAFDLDLAPQRPC